MRIWTLTLAVVGIGFICHMPKAKETETVINEYPMTTVVTSVDYTTDIVTIQDFNGFEWQFTGTEDWTEGSICSCIMSDKGTPYIFDDEIITVKYDGWFDGFPR